MFLYYQFRFLLFIIIIFHKKVVNLANLKIITILLISVMIISFANAAGDLVNGQIPASEPSHPLKYVSMSDTSNISVDKNENGIIDKVDSFDSSNGYLNLGNNGYLGNYPDGDTNNLNRWYLSYKMFYNKTGKTWTNEDYDIPSDRAALSIRKQGLFYVDNIHNSVPRNIKDSDLFKDYTRFVVTPTAKVGIGMSEPSHALDIQGDGANIKLTTSTDKNHALSLYNDKTGKTWNIYQLNSTDTPKNGLLFEFGDGAAYTRKMVIAENGYVGIGINEPTKLLEVNGDSRFNGRNLYLMGANADQNQGILFAGWGVAHGRLNWRGNTHTFTLDTGDDADDTDGAYGNANLYVSGKVGIGRQPSTELDVAGTVNATKYCIGPSDCITSFSNAGLWLKNSNGDIYAKDTNSKVGIGTEAPSVKLDIVGDAKVSGGITGGASTIGGVSLTDKKITVDQICFNNGGGCMMCVPKIVKDGSICKDDGSGWSSVICTANQKECLPSGDAYRQCNDQGTAWLPNVACPSGCLSGNCISPCTAGTTKCDDSNTKILTCNAAGTSYSETASCPNGCVNVGGAAKCYQIKSATAQGDCWNYGVGKTCNTACSELGSTYACILADGGNHGCEDLPEYKTTCPGGTLNTWSCQCRGYD